MENGVRDMEIDLVYLWVDGSDPAWQAKRAASAGNLPENTETNCKGRYANNDELKYSLRSVEKYAPWIRKIFIVTDNQTPDWLDTENPKIKIVDHKDIIPQERLPCFSSVAIEYYLYKIPGLSEQFLYANDDMFINKPVSPDTFFLADGLPVIRLKQWTLPRRALKFWEERIPKMKKALSPYSRTILNAKELVKKKYGIRYGFLPHHNMDAYLKSGFRKVVEDVFKEELEAQLVNCVRGGSDIQRVVFQYVALAEKRGHLRRVSPVNESLHVCIHLESDYKKLEKHEPMLFCMNDSEFAGDSDRERLKAWLSNRFPEKSVFEK
jgi:hypothetical protein